MSKHFLFLVLQKKVPLQHFNKKSQVINIINNCYAAY